MIAQTAETNHKPCVKCLRCGRVLRSTSSTARGMGRWCARKVKAAAALEVPATVAAEPASNVVPFRVREKVRTSTQIAGLTLEISTADDRTCVTFTYGRAWEAYQLAAGRAFAVDCSDRWSLPSHVATHVRQVAAQMAARLGQVAR